MVKIRKFPKVTKESRRDLEYVKLKLGPSDNMQEGHLSRPPWKDKFPIKNPFHVLKCHWLESRTFNKKFSAQSMQVMAGMTN